MEQNKKNKEFLTDHERAVYARHNAIMRDWQRMNDGIIKPWRIYLRIANKYGMTAMGVSKVVQRYQNIKCETK